MTDDRGYAAWFRTSPAHDGSPHVEKVGNEWRYIVTERGMELQRRTTVDADEVLYWLVKDVTFELASRYELEHRSPSLDFRRLLFAKEEELLGEISPEWAQRYAAEMQTVLQQHPFVDGPHDP